MSVAVDCNEDRRSDSLDSLRASVSETLEMVLSDPHALRGFLEWSSTSLNYGAWNRLALWSQSANGGACRSAGVWKSIGLQPVKGSHGLAILLAGRSPRVVRRVFCRRDVAPRGSLRDWKGAEGLTDDEGDVELVECSRLVARHGVSGFHPLAPALALPMIAAGRGVRLRPFEGLSSGYPDALKALGDAGKIAATVLEEARTHCEACGCDEHAVGCSLCR